MPGNGDSWFLHDESFTIALGDYQICVELPRRNKVTGSSMIQQILRGEKIFVGMSWTLTFQFMDIILKRVGFLRRSSQDIALRMAMACQIENQELRAQIGELRKQTTTSAWTLRLVEFLTFFFWVAWWLGGGWFSMVVMDFFALWGAHVLQYPTNIWFQLIPSFCKKSTKKAWAAKGVDTGSWHDTVAKILLSCFDTPM